MKKYTLILLAIISTSTLARITDADVVRDAAWAASQHTSVPQSEIDDQWRDFNKPPNEVGQNATVTQYSVRNGEKRLKPTGSHICVMSNAGGYYHRGLKGVDVNVFQRSGYWYLKASSSSSDNWGAATCWNK